MTPRLGHALVPLCRRLAERPCDRGPTGDCPRRSRAAFTDDFGPALKVRAENGDFVSYPERFVFGHGSFRWLARNARMISSCARSSEPLLDVPALLRGIALCPANITLDPMRQCGEAAAYLCPGHSLRKQIDLLQLRLTAKCRSRGWGPSVVGPLLIGIPKSE
jgi:hypothetical protein